MRRVSVVFESAIEQRRLIADRQISAVELAQAHLDHIAKFNPALNAIVTIVEQRALEQARAADEATKRGDEVGVLHGLPMAHKDLANTEGIRTTHGSPIFSDNVPSEDDLIVARMRSAGGVQIGKTNTPEFGAGSQTFNEVFGATKNPYDTGRTCGGSSGGAAVALAAGFVPIADGSDMGGSLRNPASFCNVVGLRPTPGLVPTWPTTSVWAPWGVVGPMGRTVDDVALLLSAIAGPDPRVAVSPHIAPHEFASPIEPIGLDGLKIAWAPNLDGLPVDPAVTSALAPMRDLLEALGATTSVACPDLSSAGEVFQVMRSVEFAAKMGALRDQHADQMKSTVVWNIDETKRRPLSDMAAAVAAQGSIHASVVSFFDDYDLLACPVSQVPPFAIETEWITEIDGVKMDTYIDWMRSCSDITVTGCPALSLPAAFTAGGLPVGIQLVARRGDDLRLLRIAKSIEQAIDIDRWPASVRAEAR